MNVPQSIVRLGKGFKVWRTNSQPLLEWREKYMELTDKLQNQCITLDLDYHEELTTLLKKSEETKWTINLLLEQRIDQLYKK